MKVSHITNFGSNNYSQWVDVMRQANADISIGNNPVLSEILQSTWGWPFVQVLLNYQNIPIGHFQALKIGKSWVSLPHFDHGGVWVDTEKFNEMISSKLKTGLSEEAIHQRLIKLIQHALIELGDSWKNQEFFNFEINESDLLELTEHVVANEVSGLQCRSKFPLLSYHASNKALSVLKLQDSHDKQLKTFTSNLRRKIRKAEKNGIVMEVGGVEHVNQFYAVYRENIHQLGSFALPVKFFQNLLEKYDFGSARIILASYQGRNVGAAVYLDFLEYAENGWFASLWKANSLYVTYALHNKMINLAIQNNCKKYSFGRSTVNSSVHYYKKQWGGTDEPLYFNSTSKTTNSGKLYEVASPVIKKLPRTLVSVFDWPVSRFIY